MRKYIKGTWEEVHKGHMMYTEDTRLGKNKLNKESLSLLEGRPIYNIYHSHWVVPYVHPNPIQKIYIKNHIWLLGLTTQHQ